MNTKTKSPQRPSLVSARRSWALGALTFLTLLATACGSSTADSAGSDTATESETSTDDETVADDETSSDSSEGSTSNEGWIDAWILNADGETSANIGDAPVNVQSAEIITVDGAEFMEVASTGIPNYTLELNEYFASLLTDRPFYDTDFADGVNVGVGDVVAFGQDIGYVSACDGEENVGAGYWPPGPACPTEQATSALFPLDPQLAADGEHTTTGAGIIGLWVNGVSIFNWGDTTSYVNGTWALLAPVAESRDLDVCPGHSANGEYHHHSNPVCLGAQLGDDGSAHSPIYGFAADGFPIYGPWADASVLARSSWVVRDLDDADSATGCGEAGARTCLMVDQLDPSLGVAETANVGPTTSDEDTSLSGNVFPTVAGYFMEDYYYDDALNDGSVEGLDQYNGHDHDDLGYHYHVTSTDDGEGNLLDAFPYYIGLELAGVIQDGAPIGGGAGGGGDGGPPGGDGGGDAGGGAPDFSEAAASLGITEEEFLEALGDPPPDLTAAAEALGITEEELTDLIGPPPG